MIFDEKNEKQVREIFDLYKKYNNEYLDIAVVFDNELNNEYKRVICPKSLYCQSVLNILENADIEKNDHKKVLEYAKDVYKQLFVSGEETENFDVLSKIFHEMFIKSGFIVTHCFDIKIFNIFYNCENYYKWMKSVDKSLKFAEIKNLVYEYGIEARAYFANEESFTSNFIYVCEKMLTSENTEEVFNTMKRDIEHMAGIYDVDEAMLCKAEQDIASAKDIINKSGEILAVMEKRIKTIDEITLHAVDRINSVIENEMSLAKARLDDIDVKLQSAYDEFLRTQKESVLFEKDKLVEQVREESQDKLSELKENVRSIISLAKFEISKFNSDANNTIDRLKSFVTDNEKLNTMLKDGAERDELLKKIEKLTILNEGNMKLLNDRLERELNADDSKINAGKEIVISAPNVRQKAITVPQAEEPEASDTDYDCLSEINPLLDEGIPFSERFGEAMVRKKRLEEKGEHFHEKFNDVLTAVMENANPYLIGPTGCGKTYMVSQLCRILDMSFIDIGYINEEYDILGFQTANGGYSRPNFYRCYKYGKIAFCDELDNGNSRATVKLNSFLGNTKDAGYNFPNGEFVKRHGNFRIIAAGNTAGNGADSNYNTREKIEESVQQRFTPIYVGYDNEIERAIIGQYTAIFEFIVHFREATNAWSRKSHMSASGIITTRDTARIRKYLDNNSFSVEKILDYEFIQTKDEVYLGFLADHMKANVKEEDASFNIINSFCEKVEAIRNGDIIR